MKKQIKIAEIESYLETLYIEIYETKKPNSVRESELRLLTKIYQYLTTKK